MAVTYAYLDGDKSSKKIWVDIIKRRKFGCADISFNGEVFALELSTFPTHDQVLSFYPTYLEKGPAAPI